MTTYNLTREKTIEKLANNKKIVKSMNILGELSKKYKMTFSFGSSEVVLDNRPERVIKK